MSSTKTIVLRVRGGLGNQLFQFSYAYALQKQFSVPNIELDIRAYMDYCWPFLLNRYDLGEHVCVSADATYECDGAVKRYHFWRGLMKRIKGKQTTTFSARAWKHGYLLSERYCPLPTALPEKESVFLYGYFQDASILFPYREELKALFVPKTLSDACQQYIGSIGEKSIAVSVRMRDPSEGKSNTFQYDGRGYYLESIKKILFERPGIKQIVIACNDIERIRKEGWFEGLSIEPIYLSGLDAVEQIHVLRQAKHFICGNSTFSWWMAFLGSGDDSIVYLPKRFYNGVPTAETKLCFSGVTIAD